MSFNVRVDSFRNKNDDGPVEATAGLSVDSGQLNVNGKVVVSGITTVGFVTAQHATVGVLSATTLFGDGAGLTNVPTVTTSKAFALKLLFSDPPLRS
jgi:hypothetical protein